jgi:hypothetical protein
MANQDMLELPSEDGATRRLVGVGGYSRTIAGALKILLGVVIKLTGWAIAEGLQLEIVEGLSLLIGIGLDLWGVGQVMHARQSRGDINLLGQRIKPVETVVLPTPPPESRVEGRS